LDDGTEGVEDFLDRCLMALSDGSEGKVGLACFGYVDDSVGEAGH
jgi:hypothetical protein